MEDAIAEQIKAGVGAVSSISSQTLCINKQEFISDMDALKLKKRLILYFKTHKTAYISDLSEHFRTKPRIVYAVVTQLKKDGILTDVV